MQNIWTYVFFPQAYSVYDDEIGYCQGQSFLACCITFTCEYLARVVFKVLRAPYIIHVTDMNVTANHISCCGEVVFFVLWNPLVLCNFFCCIYIFFLYCFCSVLCFFVVFCSVFLSCFVLFSFCVVFLFCLVLCVFVVFRGVTIHVARIERFRGIFQMEMIIPIPICSVVRGNIPAEDNEGN